MTQHGFTVVRCENLRAVLAVFVSRTADSFAGGHNALPPSLRSVALCPNVQFIRDLRVGLFAFVLLRARDSRADLAQVPRRFASHQLPIQYPSAFSRCSLSFVLQSWSARIYPRSPCVSLRLATSRALLVYRQSYRVTLIIKSHPVTPLIIGTMARPSLSNTYAMNLFFLIGLSETIALHTDQTFLDSTTTHGRRPA